MLDRQRLRSLAGLDRPIDVWKVAATVGIVLVLAVILAVIERDRRIRELPPIGRVNPNAETEYWSGWSLDPNEVPDASKEEPSRLHAD